MAEKSYKMELTLFNDLPQEAAYAEFLRCCGSTRWATEMTNRRPYASFEQLKETASNLWWSMPPEEWLKAFSAHPKIGDAKALKEKFAHKNSWEGDEQSGANTATEEVLNALQVLNTEYDLKNGFIFLICATGKSATEMLDALQNRLRNDRETELQIAAGEQAKITNLRLVKLLQSLSINSKL